MLLGSYTFGTLSDYIGRRMCFQLTIAVFAVGSGLCFFAENTWQLGALRVLTGFGIGGFIPVDTALMSEFMPARRRGLMMGLWNSFLLGWLHRVSQDRGFRSAELWLATVVSRWRSACHYDRRCSLGDPGEPAVLPIEGAGRRGSPGRTLDQRAPRASSGTRRGVYSSIYA